MSTFETALLQLLLTRGIGTRTVDRVLAAAAARGQDWASLCEGPVDAWTGLGLKPEQAAGVVQARSRAQQVAGQLESRGISLLVRGQPRYPARLVRSGAAVVPVLFTRNNVALCERPAVAFCGSRRASAAGLLWARQTAARLAGEAVHVVSGYAAGIDLAAHAASLEASGTTTLVLAEGILHFRIKPEIGELLDEERTLILSEFGPLVPWSVGNAMQRNSTVLALADVVIVVEAGLDGGTFAAGEQALREHRPLYVLDSPQLPPSAAGNRELLARGARPLTPDFEAASHWTDFLAVVRGRTVSGDPPAHSQASPVQRLLFE